MAVSGSGASSSVLGTLTMIVNEEGPMGLLRGMIPRVTYVAPAVTIFFIVYEATQQRLKSWGTFVQNEEAVQKPKRQ